MNELEKREEQADKWELYQAPSLSAFEVRERRKESI